jgi:hypothetical protein
MAAILADVAPRQEHEPLLGTLAYRLGNRTLFAAGKIG